MVSTSGVMFETAGCCTTSHNVAYRSKLDPHPPPRNANNVEPYTFVTLFSGKFDTHPPPSALRNTWMAPKATLWNMEFWITELYINVFRISSDDVQSNP